MQAFTATDLIGILSASHREIERALASLSRIGKESRGGALREPAAFAQALRYFRFIAPEHSAAEEEILFPALRSTPDPETKNLPRLIDTLEEEHGCADRAHEEVNRLGGLWLTNGELSTVRTTRLTAILEGLTADLALLGAQLAKRQAAVAEGIAR